MGKAKRIRLMKTHRTKKECRKGFEHIFTRFNKKIIVLSDDLEKFIEAFEKEKKK